MPLRDHFRPPLVGRLPWRSLHSGWCSEITRRLNRQMPPGYYALENMSTDGGFEIDIGAAEGESHGGARRTAGGGGGTAVVPSPAVYTPPAARGSCSYTAPDLAEVRVFTADENKIVAAIELVSPRNQDRPGARDDFVGKCLNYIASGVSLVIVDVVTTRRTNFHNTLVEALRGPVEVELPDDEPIYAAAYRPTGESGKPRIEFWAYALRVGDQLPTMPLRLLGNQFLPVELEVTYTTTCEERLLEG